MHQTGIHLSFCYKAAATAAAESHSQQQSMVLLAQQELQHYPLQVLLQAT
jgi:hypothetical protein